MNKEKFACYEKIRRSGVTNMWATNLVMKLSKWLLNKDDCLDIMKNYKKYSEQYLTK